ncbi:hypothetical protein PTKIN_Ptkin17bG0044900 [Pterospermum kingtungense]
MAKLSFTCKYGGTTWDFSESEIDVARQLIKLCSDDDGIGLTGKRRRVEDDEFGAASAVNFDIEDDDFKPRKRKSRSIHYIYRSTEPPASFRC